MLNPYFGGPYKNGGHHFGTSGGHFELKLGKHVHFVIFSIFDHFGEILKNLKNFDFDHILPNILALTPKLEHPLEFRGNIV